MKEIYFESSDYDALAIARININLLSKEPALYTTKWWDYRLLHPVQATYAFEVAYIKSCRAYVKKNYDLEYGKVFKPYPGKDLFAEKQLELTPVKKKVRMKNGKPLYMPHAAKSTISGVWKARQMADSLGIPYEFYCEAAFQYTEKCLWHRLPAPSHLYATSPPKNQEFREQSIVEFIFDKWQKHLKTTLARSTALYYTAEKNQNSYDQIRHRSSVMTQIKSRPAPKYALSQALFLDKILIRAECELFFGVELVNRAEKISLD